MKTNLRDYLRFRVGAEWYGVPVETVIEVLQMVALNEVPGADILGMMTLRDEIMPVIDLRRRFGLPDGDLRLDTPIIAVRAGQNGMGLVVDEADDVVHVPQEKIAPCDTAYVKQVARLDQNLLLILDPAALQEIRSH